jgi:Replication-relaxation
MIGTFASAPALDRRIIVDPGLLPYRDRACLRILYRADVATTAQLTTLVYRRRQTAQERLSALYRVGYLDRAVLPPLARGGAPLAFRVSAQARRRLGYLSLTRFRAGTQLRHSLNVVESVCALVRATAPSDEPLAQLWYPEYNASDLLPGVYPDSVVVLQAPSGSAVLCLEIDEGTEHGPQIRDKLDRYGDALVGRSGWHVVFVAPSRQRVDFLVRVAKRRGHPSLTGRVWPLVLGDLSESGLGTTLAPLFLGGRRLPLADLVTDAAPRRCPTPVGTGGWLEVLGTGGSEETDEALGDGTSA